MPTDNSIQIGVVLSRSNDKPITVWIYSEHAAPVAQGMVMRLLRRESCRIDPETLMSKIVLEMVEYHFSNSLGTDQFRVGVQMYPHVNQMYIIDPVKDMIRSTNIERRNDNLKMRISEYLTEFEKRAKL